MLVRKGVYAYICMFSMLCMWCRLNWNILNLYKLRGHLFFRLYRLASDRYRSLWNEAKDAEFSSCYSRKELLSSYILCPVSVFTACELQNHVFYMSLQEWVWYNRKKWMSKRIACCTSTICSTQSGFRNSHTSISILRYPGETFKNGDGLRVLNESKKIHT